MTTSRSGGPAAPETSLLPAMRHPVDRRDLERFAALTYDDFRAMAVDDSLSDTEKIGFPDGYRAGAEAAVLDDIVAKLPALERRGARLLDIGTGCSDLPRMLLELCARRGHEAVLVDSPEMLAHLPDAPHVVKVPGAFPDVALPPGRFDAILAYSVLHYVHPHRDAGAFVDRALALLAPGGALLLGDIPNVSKRARFLSGPEGAAFHRRFTGTDEPPPRELVEPPPGGIDDELVLSLVRRARGAGFDAYVVPLAPGLPLANRREDVVVVRP